MRTLFTILLLVSTAFAGGAKIGGTAKIGGKAGIGSTGTAGAAGCGVNTGGIPYDQSTCGPRATSTWPATGTNLNTNVCATANTAISAGSAGSPNVYYLNQNIGDLSTAGNTCLTPKNDVTINLNGFTVYGAACVNGNLSGFTMENGTVIANISGGSPPAACSFGAVISINNAFSCPTNINNFFDLRIRQLNQGDSLRVIHIDRSVGSDCLVVSEWFDHVNIESPPLPWSSGSRTSALYSQGNISRTFVMTKVTNSIILGLADANAQQGILCYQNPYCLIDSNFFYMPCVVAGIGDSGRAMMADGADGFTGAKHATFTNNYVDVCNNRGLRVRNSSDVVATNNYFANVQTLNGSTGLAIHLGDGDTGDADLGLLNFSGNVIELRSNATAATLRRAYMTGGLITGTTFKCSVFGCSTPTGWWLKQSVGDGTRSEWTVKADTYTGITVSNLASHGRVSDSKPVFSYNGITTPTVTTSEGSANAPTITDVGP